MAEKTTHVSTKPSREYQTLLVREAQFHSLLLRYGMHRMGLPGTEEERKRSEFFKGSLAEAKRALKAIGRGDYFEFESNDISKMRKQTLTRGDEIETMLASCSLASDRA